MLLTILYRLPGLSSGVHTALRVMLLAVTMLAALALAVAVCMAIVGGYAMLTIPQAKAVRA